MRKNIISICFAILAALTLTSCTNLLAEADKADTTFLKADSAVLVIGFTNGDSASSVTGNLTLPATNGAGTAISWASGNTDAISNSGVVTRLAFDTNVILTATLKSGNASTDKTFTLTVKAMNALQDQKITLSAIAGINAPVTKATPVTTITATDQYTGTVTWSGSPVAFAALTGYTATITLTAKTGYTITGVAANFFTVAGSSSCSQEASSLVVTAVFPATAAAPPTDTESVALDKASLVIAFASGENLTRLTQSITLPVTGANGTTITWVSDNAAVTATGTVTRPNGTDATVNLTATITRGSSSVTKVFALTVKATGTSGITVTLPTAPSATDLVFQSSSITITSFNVTRGTTVTVTTTFTGTDYSWYVDGNTAAVSSTGSCALNGNLYSAGHHTLLLDVLSGGKYYSGRIDFTVTYELLYAVGDTGPGGGKVFYDKGSKSDGWRYLEAAPADLGRCEWYSEFMDSTTGPTGTAIGTGSSNTAAMTIDAGASDLHPAAAACKASTIGGKSDWFLPSLEELTALYTALANTSEKCDANGFSAWDSYWSSTQKDSMFAWELGFNSGTARDEMKAMSCYVRPVRAF